MPVVGVEPTRVISTRDFESGASCLSVDVLSLGGYLLSVDGITYFEKRYEKHLKLNAL